MRKVSCAIFRLYLSDSCEGTQRRTIIRPSGGLQNRNHIFYCRWSALHAGGAGTKHASLDGRQNCGG
jgi:hypothetical protein